MLWDITGVSSYQRMAEEDIRRPIAEVHTRRHMAMYVDPCHAELCILWLSCTFLQHFFLPDPEFDLSWGRARELVGSYILLSHIFKPARDSPLLSLR